MADKEKNATQAPLPPISRRTLKSGLINKGAVAENEMPDSAVSESINMNFDAIGAAQVRKGSTLLGNNLGSAILGLYYFADTVGAPSYTQLIAVAATAVYYLAAGVWTSIRTGLTSGSQARFATLINMVFMVNGTEATEVWDGNPGGGFVSTGNASGAPTGTFIETFIGRVWIGGNATYPDRLYYSSIPSAASTQVVTWSTDPVTGTQWFDMNQNDGDTVTALQRFRSWLIVFKNNRLYRVMGITQADTDPYYAVGTSSQESVIETKAGLFFHHASGIYQMNIYGIVQEVSRPIWDIIRAIPSSYYAKIVGWYEADQDHVCWSVGTVTVNGTTYTNLVVRYTISTQAWTHYSYPTAAAMSVRRYPYYTDGTALYALTGDTAGNVIQMNYGLTDLGTPIPYSLIHKWDFLDDTLSTRKIVNLGNFSHYGGAGSNVDYQTETNDPDALNDWSKRVGQLRGVNTGFPSMNIKCRKIRFRISGESTGQQFSYLGYELLDVLNEYFQFSQK